MIKNKIKCYHPEGEIHGLPRKYSLNGEPLEHVTDFKMHNPVNGFTEVTITFVVKEVEYIGVEEWVLYGKNQSD